MKAEQIPGLIVIGIICALVMGGAYFAISALTGLTLNSTALIAGIGATSGVVAATWASRHKSA